MPPKKDRGTEMTSAQGQEMTRKIKARWMLSFHPMSAKKGRRRAKRAALIYSLACSCRLNNINSFEYFKDLLTKLIDINPNTDHETIRNLLPHKWQR